MQLPAKFWIYLFVAVGFCAIGKILAGVPAADVGKPFDLQSFIDRQIQAGTNRVVIPPGRYRVTPQNGTHLQFQNLTNVEIIADGVEMICTETRQAVGLIHCCNLHLRGLTVDYDPLPMTEGRIVALAPDKSWVEIQIIDGYPEDNLVNRIEIYDPVTGELRRTTYHGWGNFERLGPGRYRVSKGPNYRYKTEVDTEIVGDVLVTNHAHPSGASGHAFRLEQCKAVELAGVSIYASPVFGFFEHQCEATSYLGCKIDRRPLSTDLVKRGFARMRSLDADAYHSSEASTGPSIVDCVAKFMGDDAVNIHGRYAMITACTGEVLRVAAPHGNSIKSGDQVEFLPFHGERPPDALVTKIEPDGPITDAEKSFVETLPLLRPETIKEVFLAGKVKFYRLTVNPPVSLPMGSLVAAADRVGNGFLIKGCDFGFNRSRGILIKASHGQVVNNTITHGWMAAVLVSPEFWWLEAGCSSDVLISGNKIIGCREPAIQVVAPDGHGQPLTSGAHHNITIYSNNIAESVWPNIYVTSTANLVVNKNQLTPVSPVFTSLSRSKWSIPKNEPARQILVENCFAPQLQPVP